MSEPATSPEHHPRLTRELAALLRRQRVAALGTLAADGTPFVSMVPFAVEPGRVRLVIHVSDLAPHTRHLLERPAVSLLVQQGEVEGEPVHALPRVSLQASAEALDPDSEDWVACRAAYLARFPEAEPMTQLGDFRFVGLDVLEARQVAGFGAARHLDREGLEAALRLSLSPVESE
jgi:heme iron utilization protein